MAYALDITEKWLGVAGIDEGSVFRGFYKGEKRLRPKRMTVRTLNRIVEKYYDGLTPHDLRRSYARLQYEAGMDILSISQNFGHASIQTTKGYIGTMDAQRRAGKIAIPFDLGRLEAI